MQIDILAELKSFDHIWMAFSLLNNRVENMNNNPMITVEERHGRLRRAEHLKVYLFQSKFVSMGLANIIINDQDSEHCQLLGRIPKGRD